MSTYRVVPAGDRFEVIETSPDGRDVMTLSFPTEAAAVAWLVRHLEVVNKHDLMRWLAKKTRG